MTVPATPQPPLDVPTFRSYFTAFGDAAVYPDATVQWWLDQGAVLLDPELWCDIYQLGQGLWAAHELAKFQMATLAGANNPSGIGGIVQSKAVNGVSVSYDTSIGTEDGAGQYNLTIYGRQFYHRVKLIGMGPIQIGAASCPPPGSGGAWVGPPPWPGWFSS
jgi:hypothetical protein